MLISRPMKPATFNPQEAIFPYLCTPKIDGIRYIAGEECFLSCSMKPIPNKAIQAQWSPSIVGLEGEFFFNNFNATQSIVMAYDADIRPLGMYSFDYVGPTCPVKPYRIRTHEMKAVFRAYSQHRPFSFTRPLMPVLIPCQRDLDLYLADCLEAGFEGVILRAPLGLYKQGRATGNLMFRIKPFEDDEATVVGFEPLEANDNPSVLNERGLLQKSHAKHNKRQLDMLGAFVLKSPKWSGTFNCGGGLTDPERRYYWQEQDNYLGMLVKFKYQAHGTKDKPRSAIFLGFRNPLDMDNE